MLLIYTQGQALLKSYFATAVIRWSIGWAMMNVLMAFALNAIWSHRQNLLSKGMKNGRIKKPNRWGPLQVDEDTTH
jgi:hypothetical protein